MVRTILIALAISVTLSASGTTRYVTDRSDAPVKWVEWGKAAIERSKNEKRPLFVSIGYAASWDCQRMHREAFLNGENAEALNAYFVPVLLDRIEYPEVAEALENQSAEENPTGAVGATAGRRPPAADSLPLNLILTPNLEPFAVAGFMSSAELNRMLVINANRWVSERAAVIAEGKARIAASPERRTLSPPASRESPHTIEELRVLAAGPRRDQLGGGFHRCATCYEKLLSEQALLAMEYLDAWQTTRDPEMAHVARTTLDAAIRDLVPPGGLFQSAQYAYSLVPGQGPVFVDGAFYLWTKDEITRLLGNDTAGKVFQLYGLKDGIANRLVLEDPRFLHETHDELAEPLRKLLDVRQKRPAPFREVAVAGWNGLMISALARGAVILDQPGYLDAATNAAKLVSTKLWSATKRTLDRTESHTPAIAEDYAFLVQGLLDLFESTSDAKWLNLAIALQQGAARQGIAISVPEIDRRLAALAGRGAEPAIVVVTGDPRKPETQELLKTTRVPRAPKRIVLFLANKGAQRQQLLDALPFLGALTPDPEHPTTYECVAGQCVKE